MSLQEPQALQQPVSPVFTPPPTIRTQGLRVLMDTPMDGASLYYTIDGRDPTPASLEYPSGYAAQKNPADPQGKMGVELPIGSHVVKAIAVKDGVSSTIATAFCEGQPRGILLMPEEGEYREEVIVTVQSDHSEVRFTQDGSIPTIVSPIFRPDGRLVLNTPGVTSITAAMFHEGAVIGTIARKTYTILPAQLPTPIILPVSGTYQIPLKVSIEGRDETHYSTSSSGPIDNFYTSPIIFSTPGELTVRAQSRCADGTRLASTVAEETYVLVEDVGGVQQSTRPTLTTDVPNVDFVEADVAAAHERSEAAVAWILAATQHKRELLERRAAHLESIKQWKERYRKRWSALETLQHSMNLAVARREVLLAEAASLSKIEVEARIRLSELEAKEVQLKQRGVSLQSQIDQVGTVFRKLASEKEMYLQKKQKRREELEARFILNKKKLAAFSSNVIPEAEESRIVVAEQRHELWVLRETLSTLKKNLLSVNLLAHVSPPSKVEKDATPSGTSPSTKGGMVQGSGGSEFLPTKPLIDLPTLETMIPIPTGKLRLITTVQGDGLQKLRTKHGVNAWVVQTSVDQLGTEGKDGRALRSGNPSSALAVVISGHSNGVFNFAQEVQKILRSSS